MRRMTKPSTRPALLTAAVGVFVAALMSAFTAAQAPASAPVAATPAAPRGGQPTVPGGEAQLATIKQYCATCHSDRAKMAGVSFEGITAESIGPHADVFEKAVRKLRGRVMPPPGAPQPNGAAVDSLVGWLEGSLDR